MIESLKNSTSDVLIIFNCYPKPMIYRPSKCSQLTFHIFPEAFELSYLQSLKVCFSFPNIWFNLLVKSCHNPRFGNGIDCDHVKNTRQELNDRTLCHQVLCSNFNEFEEFCQLDIDRKYCNWFFCLTRSDSSTKTCNKFCLSFVYDVSFLKLQIFVSFLSFAWKVLHQEISECLGPSFFVSQNTRYFSAFVAKLRIST